MKPPASKSRNMRLRGRGRGSGRSRATRRPASGDRKKNVMLTSTGLPPASLPSFNLSFGSDLNSELFSLVDRLGSEPTSSTPMPHYRSRPKHSTVKSPVAPLELDCGDSNVCTSSILEMSTSQVGMQVEQDSSKLRMVESLPSFMTTPSRSGVESELKLSQWGIPQPVLEQYVKRGITEMYQWQAECLKLPGVLQGRNLVFSAPTSAGKTFVAELLALKCILESKKKVVIILPFVSIAHEKANYLQSIFEPNGVKVGAFVGGQSPAGGFSSVDIAICTIEKANSLLNRLLEEGGFSELGAVVVDELHMIGDSHRGYLLELLLTKILYICRKSRISGSEPAKCEADEMVVGDDRNEIQIIGMSATLPNLDTLAKWLEAALYCTDYRPVPLQEMVKVGATIFDTNFKKIREISGDQESSSDEEDIVQLCRETVTAGHSVLIFCPTKQWCETLARAVATSPFLQHDSTATNTKEPDTEKGSEFSLQYGALQGVLEQLKRTQVGLDGVLEKTVPCGVGFHHAGLTFDEREIIEGSFRQGLLRILVATSTLSSGVNLPARLVIIRTPFFQRSLLDVLVYKQMVGRAGRKGVDDRGESVLICKPNEKSKVSELFVSTPAPVTSCLDVERRRERGKSGDVVPIRRALLEVVTSGAATNQVEIETYVTSTLLFAEMKKAANTPLQDPMSFSQKLVCSTVDYLLANEFIAARTPLPLPGDKDPATDSHGAGCVREFHATQLGAATVSSALSPEEALVVFSELRKARHSFVLESELHIIYLVTPVYVQEQWPSIDWYCFLRLLERLPFDARHVATTLGVCESFLARAVQGRLPERTTEQRERLHIHRRFFTALALHDLVHEAPIVYVAGKYGVSKGLLQTLQSAAGTFSGMVTVFCARLGWKNLELLLSQFQSRLSFGVERELCDLVRIPLVNGFRARALYNAGFHTLAALATANPLAIELCLRNSVPFKSSKSAVGDSRGNTWCARLRRGMTEYEAAREIVHRAQKILSEQMNVPLSAWKMIQPLPHHTRQHTSPAHKVGDPADTGEVKEEALREPPSTKRRKPSILAGEPVLKSAANNIVPHGDGENPTSAFKTSDNERKAVCKRKGVSKPGRRSIGQFKSSPVIVLSRVTTNSTRPTTANIPAKPPLIKPEIDPEGPDESISYSPLFSQDSTKFDPSLSLLHTPLSVEHSQHEVSHDKVADTPPCAIAATNTHSRATDSPSEDKHGPSSSHPLTIPNSLPCSMDMSISFSRSTLAMIDAACEALQPMDENSATTAEPGTSSVCVAERDDVVKVAESPLDSSHSLTRSNTTANRLNNAGKKAKTLVTEQAVVEASRKTGEAKRNTVSNPESLTVGEGNSTKCQTKPCEAPTHLSSSPCPAISSQSRLRDLSLACDSQISLSQSGACLIDVSSNPLLFETFVSECLEQSSISFSVAVTPLCGEEVMGFVVVEEGAVRGLPVPQCHEQVVGVAFTWGGMDAYYISFAHTQRSGNGSVSLGSRIDGLCSIFRSVNCQEMVAYSVKRNWKVLVSVFGVVPTALCLDPLVADWMLNPDGKEKTLHKMVLHYLPDQPLFTDGDEEMPLSSLATHGSEPHLRAASEAILASLLLSKLRPLLQEEGLLRPFLGLEMPSLVVLTKAEFNGIGFSQDDCKALKQLLELRLSHIENEAYTHAGRSFSLTSPEDVSRVLFLELQLPPPADAKQQKTLGPNRRGKRRLQHISTAKDVLEKLKPLHPLPGLILEWRRVSATVTKTVFPLFKDAVRHKRLDSIRIHSSYQFHTATGRVATSDPNLQMVPKEYDIGTKSNLTAVLEAMGSSTDACSLVSESQCYRESSDREEAVTTSEQKSTVNMRSVFVPFPGGVFLAADYSQLELRVLAHMSGDEKLQQVLNSDGDVFRMISSEWLGVPEHQITPTDRQNAKQICYGMVYGIGAKALAEQLGITVEDAIKFMDRFKSKYPTIKKFITNTIQSCSENGYVVTLLGRKRYLSGIHSQNVHARSQAERQAVNTTIQGSAADLVKTAMSNIDCILTTEFNSSILTGLSALEGRGVRGAYLVLQLHDELLYEVGESDLSHVARIVKQEMESALRLTVRFPVKMKVGTSWGNLTEYLPPATF